jgi:uncharacterized lipoprotein YmbA
VINTHWSYSMKRLSIAAIVLTLLTACASLGVPTPQTFNEKEAAAISSVAAIRTTAESLLTANKITAPDAQNIQRQADNAREAIVVASAIHATDPGAAENRLTAIITGLNAISAYLASRGN